MCGLETALHLDIVEFMQRGRVIRIIGLFVGLLILLGLACAAFMQQGTISQLRLENQKLQEDLKEVDRLRTEVKEAGRLRNQEIEIQQLREQTRDLLRLRNEVRQLREQLAQVEVLRAANAEFLQAAQGTNFSPNQQALIAAARKKGAILGVNVHSADDPQVGGRYRGALVMSIDPNSPVTKSDLKAGDIIVRLDGKSIETPGQLQAEMLTRKPGQMVTLDVIRNDVMVRVSVELRGWPQ